MIGRDAPRGPVSVEPKRPVDPNQQAAARERAHAAECMQAEALNAKASLVSRLEEQPEARSLADEVTLQGLDDTITQLAADMGIGESESEGARGDVDIDDIRRAHTAHTASYCEAAYC